MTDSRGKDTPTDPFRPTVTFPAKTPHPTRDPEGHSYGLPDLSLPDLNHENWRKSEDYLFGIDLFNEGYWWECHEVLEGLWHAVGHRQRGRPCAAGGDPVRGGSTSRSRPPSPKAPGACSSIPSATPSGAATGAWAWTSTR